MFQTSSVHALFLKDRLIIDSDRIPVLEPDALQAFCTAPTLCLLDPDLPFTVEVDASSSGVGVILFHW